MALLRAAVAAALLAAGCDGSGDLGTVDIQIVDGQVECDNGVCTDEYGEPVDPERVRTWLFASTETSRTSPDGLFLYFELARDDGATATVEIDVPTRDGAGDEGPLVTYIENDPDGQTVFSATAVRGRIEVAADPVGERCACSDGRIELGLDDPGEDGVGGTLDDQARRLTRGLYGWEPTFCIPSQQMPLPESEVEVEVIERCPRSTDPGREPSRPIRVDADPGCGETTPGGSGEGCESSSSADSGCESDGSSSSCEGDGGGGGSSGGCSGDSSGGGCTGDTGGEGCSGDSGGSSSCSGDTGGSSCSGSSSGCSGSGGCPGDVATAAPLAGVPRACTGRGPPGPRGNPLGGRAQLFTLIGLVLLYQVLHARRLARAAR